MNKALICSALLFAAFQASAQVEVTQPWVRATVAQQKATGAFLQLKSKSDARLVEVRASVANVTEVHEMAMEGSVMKMRAIQGLDLPAGQTVELKPGGFHVMLMDLKAPIKAGDKVALTLVFEDKSGKKLPAVEVQAEARQLGSPAADTGAHKH
ncbi:copper chaperone PCu(A)C [Paucibacter sp. Y2R2-4]|uniref:copper chaperone PCu(A)C n=1 Tax=Paucibacter sp. Y2R2-4 TaxID=2893553 RepID=UPI0021E4352A|nr:copper chaperone PCu(A)C [Paucibacter sp. Y2R2-4]MCV2352308.1 copper chaperone PCu(A)C [Paucibacter sp. Y2R2-4]